MRGLVKTLLWLFPAGFRRRFGGDMLATFEDRWREHGSWRLAARTVADLTSSAIAERFSNLREQRKPRKGDSFMKILMQDVRFALRMFIKSPGFTAVVILTLALGIGANTAIFSIVDAVLLRPLPFPEAGQLVRVVDNARGVGLKDIGMSVPELKDLQRSGIFGQMSAAWPVDGNVTGDGKPERIELLAVSPNYFALLGVRAHLGRVLGDEDRAEGFCESVVLSDGLWRRLYGADPNILGRKVRLDNDVYVVVGVMPPEFRHPGRTVATDVEMWGTAGFAADPFPKPPIRAQRFVPGAIARLKPGMTLQQAQERLNAFTAASTREYPNDYRVDSKWSVDLEPLHEAVVGNVRPLLLVLLAAVALMLLTGCVNIANLLLARASGRQREVAIRQALGAARGRLIRQLLTESVLLSLISGIVGLAAAFGTMNLFLRIVPSKMPRLNEVAVDFRVLLFALLISLLTGLFFGLAPALQTARFSLTDSLKEGGRGAGRSRRQNRMSDLLVVAEFAICMILMIGAGLLVKSFWKLTHLDPGFNPQNVLAARVWLPTPNDPKLDPYLKPEQRAIFLREVLRRMRALPSVSSAGITSNLPLTGNTNTAPIAIEGQTTLSADATLAELVSVSPDYFTVMGTPLLDGRFLSDSDQLTSPGVVLIDRSTAARFFPGRSPLGKRLKTGRLQSNAPWVTIVGLVGDIRHDGVDIDGVPHVYFSIYQRAPKTFGIVLRSPADPSPLGDTVRREVQAVDPALPIFGVRLMSDMVTASLAPHRFSAQLMGAFAVLALGLAAIGIYGVLAYSIGQRTREIGIRMALGARRSEVVRMILGQGMRLILAGVGVGVVFALGFTRLLSKLVYGVGATDPVVFAVVPLVLVLAALLASYLPAHRATRIDPVIALRAE
jgi:predicted permease